MSERYQHVEVATRAGWRAWLADHHAACPGVWLVTVKKSADPALHLPYEDQVQETLCFGWIDGVARSVDAGRTRLLMTPRRPTSRWSRPNRERI